MYVMFPYTKTISQNYIPTKLYDLSDPRKLAPMNLNDYSLYEIVVICFRMTLILTLQGYVTEIILTLEAAVDNLDIEMRPIDYMREIFMSTPNLAKEYTEGRKGSLMAPRQAIPHHARSTSYSVTGPPHRSTHR